MLSFASLHKFKDKIKMTSPPHSHLLRCSYRCFLLITLLVFSATTEAKHRISSQASRANYSLEYKLSFSQPHTHLYEVNFSIGGIRTPAIELQMPVWTPGSYMIREFARNVQDFEVSDLKGVKLRWEKVDKATWRVEVGGSEKAPRDIKMSYRVYANELTVQASHLDASHAYFNGASIFMYVKSALDKPIKLRIEAPAGWQVTSPLALSPDANGYFYAPNYDILVDSPVEIGRHRLIEFDIRGKRHRIAIWGEGDYDELRLKQDITKIVEQSAELFGELPYEHYTFILHIQPNIGGGLEHLNSTTIHCSPEVFNSRRGYISFLDLLAHEYFHLWNVKRIRPQALGPFDYQRENYTRVLWISEGVTDYYAYQLLRRAQLITPAEYFEEIARKIRVYEQTPGRFKQSAEAASFDSWIKYYRRDENSLNTAISYYLKGDLLGWLLDFDIRMRTDGVRTLDDVMRYLNDNYAARNVGFPESQLESIFEEFAGGYLTDFFARYVSGTAELDFTRYLQMAGLELKREYASDLAIENSGKQDDVSDPGWVGVELRVVNNRVQISNVFDGTTGYQAGLNAGDEIVAINGWRLTPTNYNELLNMVRKGESVTLTIFRREKLQTINLTAEKKPFDRYKIVPIKEATSAQLKLRQAWLAEAEKST